MKPRSIFDSLVLRYVFSVADVLIDKISLPGDTFSLHRKVSLHNIQIALHGDKGALHKEKLLCKATRSVCTPDKHYI